MRKSIITLSTVAVVGFSSAFFSTEAQANTVGELEDRQSQIQDEREELRENLSDAEAEIADVLVELEELNKEIEEVSEALERNQTALDETEEDIAKTEEEVDALEEEIDELEEAIEQRHDILKDRMVAYQRSGGDINYLEVIFGAQSFSDFINRVSAVNKIADSDTRLIEQQEEDKKLVVEKQDQVLVKLDELTDNKTELEGILATIEEQQNQNEEKKQALSDKEEELTALVEELEVEDSNLASLEREVSESIEAARQPAPEPTETVTASSSSDGDSSDNNSSQSNQNVKTVSKSSGNGNLSTAINAGFNHLGTPYTWGGKDPSGFDCSGFVSWAFGQAGYSLPSTTGGLASTGTKIPYSQAQPGDLVFFDTYKTNGHVGIYLGNGEFIGAQNSTGLDVASMSNVYWSDTFNGHVRRVR